MQNTNLFEGILKTF